MSMDAKLGTRFLYADMVGEILVLEASMLHTLGIGESQGFPVTLPNALENHCEGRHARAYVRTVLCHLLKNVVLFSAAVFKGKLLLLEM